MGTYSSARFVAAVVALMLGLSAHPARAEPESNDDDLSPEIQQDIIKRLDLDSTALN